MSSTNNDHLEISELQAEALREILNMGAGRAAASLGALTGEHILLSVPSVRLISVEELPEFADDYDEGSKAVMLKVSGDLTGFTSIVFSLSAAKKLLHVALDGNMSEEELEVLSEPALIELGNTVIGAVVGEFSNFLNLSLRYSTPSFLEGSLTDLVSTGAIGQNPQIIIARITFSIANGSTDGVLLIVFDVESMRVVLPAIDSYLTEQGIA